MFAYKGERRYAFVIHPDWENKLHALDLKFVPRKFILEIANAPTDELTEHQLYQQYVQSGPIKKLDAYRTYDPIKITAMFKLPYNRIPQGDEVGEPTTPDEIKLI